MLCQRTMTILHIKCFWLGSENTERRSVPTKHPGKIASQHKVLPEEDEQSSHAIGFFGMTGAWLWQEFA